MTSMSPVNGPVNMAAGSPVRDDVSPRQAPAPKTVAFELLFENNSESRARLPMRVAIYPHDATESIVSTVKNFYGIYSGPHRSQGICFEDKDGNTMIARYENFTNGMVVYVRVFDEYCDDTPVFQPGYQAPALGVPSYSPEAYNGQSIQPSTHDMARPASRISRRRSASPNGLREQREASTGSNGQTRRSRSVKHLGNLNQVDAYSEYSSDDGAHSTASGRTKEQLGNTNISLENIVEGGRRKRAKFESSELPLFAPPQMPAATSNPSVSPARRIEHHRASMSLGYSGQNPFTNPRPIIASQNYNNMQASMYAPHTAEVRRQRNSTGMTGNGVLPTPDPTVGSCVSEEDKDVALQLMRLGDMSNISHGRTSASTLDDTFSGKADAASSTGATSESESDSEEEQPPQRRQKLDEAGVSRSIYQTTEARFMPPAGELEDVDGKPKIKAPPKPKSVKSKTKLPKAPRPAGQPTVKKLPPVPGGPMSPGSAASSRKQSITSANGIMPGDDDHPDLSSKPRCQRCRKSKKGCDRQRPCGRCRDAGLSADQCVSEDEGNGRKGRYGRHMGVPIKTEEEGIAAGPPALLPAAPITMTSIMSADKAKKRKR